MSVPLPAPTSLFARLGLPWWSLVIPLAACVVLVVAWGQPLVLGLLLLVATCLITSVLVAVHHAEVIAHRLGEPFGTLVLALAVTTIEVALIISMMNSGGAEAATLARDTVYSAVMLVCTGIVGLCLLAGSLKHHVVDFRIEGSSPALSILAALTTLTLVLPQFTTTTPVSTYSASQLIFAGAMSLLLYGVYVFVQTVRHRDYFLPVESLNEDAHAEQPSLPQTLSSALLLLVSLVAVVGLAKLLAPGIEHAVAAAGAPPAVVGVAIAMLVLLPETWAALRAALANRMQTSINLALGSALATIGLSIPAVVVVSLMFGQPLVLGLPAKDMVLLALTLFVSIVTFATGRATILHGAVHLVLFAAFLFLTVVP